MRYKDLKIEFEEIFLIHENEIGNFKDCIMLEAIPLIYSNTTYADIGASGGLAVQGNAVTQEGYIKFLMGRTKAGSVLYGEKK